MGNGTSGGRRGRWLVSVVPKGGKKTKPNNAPGGGGKRVWDGIVGEEG